MISTAPTISAAPESLSLAEAAAAIRMGSITSELLMESYLQRINKRDATVGAWAQLDVEKALAMAREKDTQDCMGPLHGVPIGVKDVIDTAGMATRYGSPIYDNHVPALDAACVASLRKAGAIIIGKTVTAEFATYHPGRTANPLNPKHTPGGSSSGSAAAVADFQVPAALGTQTAGSVVRPASFCGVIGFKPSKDRYRTDGVLDTSTHLDTLGFFVRCIDDAKLLDAVLAEVQEADAQAKEFPVIGICRSPAWSTATAEMKDCLDQAGRRLKNQGARIQSVELAGVFSKLGAAQSLIHAREAADFLGPIVDRNVSQASAALIDFIQLGRGFPEADYLQALELQRDCSSQFEDAIEGVDVLLTPAASGTAPAGLAATGSPDFCRIWTALGVPCISFPVAAATNQLPLGLQLVGRMNQDRQLLQMAAKIQPAASLWENPLASFS